MKDLFGKALLDYFNGNYTEDLITSTNISGEDELPLPYLFRAYSEMPKLEQRALDLSKGKVVIHTELKDILDETETFDTILLLMNGTGIFETVSKVSTYLNHLKSLLNPNGYILIDSSDIEYMYEDEDGGLWIDTNANYYGELDYFLSYKDENEDPMKWLYLDFERLQLACESVGLKCKKVLDGEHFDYLVKIYK